MQMACFSSAMHSHHRPYVFAPQRITVGDQQVDGGSVETTAKMIAFIIPQKTIRAYHLQRPTFSLLWKVMLSIMKKTGFALDQLDEGN